MHPVARRASLVLLLGFSVIAIVSLVICRKIVHGWNARGLAVSAGGEHQPGSIDPNSLKSAIGGPAEFASAAEREISRLDGTITPDKWMALRGEKEREETRVVAKGPECLRMEKTEVLPSGGKVTRTVYFYPPPAPSPAVLSTLRGQELIDHTCILAMIRVQTRTPSEQDGRTLAHALKQQLTKKYGATVGMKGTGFAGSVAWEDAARWTDGSEIVSAYDPTEADSTRIGPEAGSVFVFSRLPIVYELEQKACCVLKAYRYRTIENAQFRRAIVIAGVDAALSERIGKLYEEVFRASASPELAQQPENMKWRESLVPVVRDWLNAVKSLAPTQRAAGLYAADRLLAAAGDVDGGVLGGQDNPELRSVLEKIGARFQFDELGKCYIYAGNWLNETRELDPEGRVGQMAVLVSLSRGQPLQLGKDQDIFHTVIANGEWLLSKSPDAATAPQVHFMIGDAYSDIVALAGGAEPDYGDPAEYSNEADSAREKALQHYRAGLASDGISENAKDAWLQAWHLSAGLLPTTRYVYIYD